jgi:hypothetical protein
MFDKFFTDMKIFMGLKENTNEDGSINWNFIDSDLFMKWSVLLDGETYTEWFDKAADIIEDELNVKI